MQLRADDGCRGIARSVQQLMFRTVNFDQQSKVVQNEGVFLNRKQVWEGFNYNLEGSACSHVCRLDACSCDNQRWIQADYL